MKKWTTEEKNKTKPTEEIDKSVFSTSMDCELIHYRSYAR